jgi:hypothetical protein
MSLAAKLRAISVASAAIFPMGFAATCLIVAVLSQAAARASATHIAGKVQGGNCPIVGSMVTLYAAGAGAPVQVARGKTDDNGTFKLNARNVAVCARITASEKGLVHRTGSGYARSFTLRDFCQCRSV